MGVAGEQNLQTKNAANAAFFSSLKWRISLSLLSAL